MKKGKVTMTITIGIAFFVLVLIIFMQFKVVYQSNETSIDTMREEDLKTELANWKSKYEDVEKKYEEVTTTLKKYKEQSSSNEETKKNLEEELANLELLLGLTDVEGTGLVITVNDPDNITEAENNGDDSIQRITSSQLMIIVNYLKDAGAEAISINNQRIVNKTDFAQITSTGYIKINSQRVSAPFEIKAIGDAEVLKGTLIGTGYVQTMRNLGQKVEFSNEKKKITINKFDGSMDFKYIEN